MKMWALGICPHLRLQVYYNSPMYNSPCISAVHLSHQHTVYKTAVVLEASARSPPHHTWKACLLHQAQEASADYRMHRHVQLCPYVCGGRGGCSCWQVCPRHSLPTRATLHCSANSAFLLIVQKTLFRLFLVFIMITRLMPTLVVLWKPSSEADAIWRRSLSNNCKNGTGLQIP